MKYLGVNEKDWKLFRSRIADWQEGYIELLTGDGNASDKFWELEKRIKADNSKRMKQED